MKWIELKLVQNLFSKQQSFPSPLLRRTGTMAAKQPLRVVPWIAAQPLRGCWYLVERDG